MGVPRINVESGQSLASAPLGTPLVVVCLRAEPDVVRRLGTLGIRPGVPIEVMHRASGGGRVVSVGGARLALARSVLEAIDATPILAEPGTPESATDSSRRSQ